METRRIAVFANSVKHGEHCVAGKCLKTGQWVRPVASVCGRELSRQQVQVYNPYGHFSVKPMQKIELSLDAPAPLINQPENYLVSAGTPWVQRYRLAPSELVRFLDHPEDLWGTGNRVSYEAIDSGRVSIKQSLYLIDVEHLSLMVDSKKRRARFIYLGVEYRLPVTDRNFDRLRSGGMNNSGVLCVSLAEPWNGYCYKIVAAIL